LRGHIVGSRYTRMARMPGLIVGWLVVLCSVLVPTRAPAQAAEAPVVLRSDLAIRKVLDTGGQGVRLAVDPVTHTLYDLDRQGNVSRVDLPPTGAATRTVVYRGPEIGTAERTQGMAFGLDGTLYVVSNRTLGPMTQALIRKGVRQASGARAWSTLASTVPYPKSQTAFDHSFNAIVVSPDGRYVYVNSGSRTDHGEIQAQGGRFPNLREVPLTAAIFRLPADAAELTLPNDAAALQAQGYLFAAGLRNAFTLAFAPNGELFAGGNGLEADYPEELNWVRAGHHYGFPWRFGRDDNPQQFPQYDPAADRRIPPGVAAEPRFYARDPSFPAPPAAFTDPVANQGPAADQFIAADGRRQQASEVGTPLYTFTPHRVPIGLTFDTAGSLPLPYRGAGFLLSWGNPAARNPTFTDAGQDLLHLQLTTDGTTYHLRTTPLVRGFQHPIDSALLGRTLYILEWGGVGTLWALTFLDAPHPR
jgi:glucose/arabinose dehydrogenase